jgi:serine/threonine protein kinase
MSCKTLTYTKKDTVLGSGSFGVTVTKKYQGKQRAVKFVPRNKFDEEEAKLLARIGKRRHIASQVDYCVTKSSGIIIMEHMKGGPLTKDQGDVVTSPLYMGDEVPKLSVAKRVMLHLLQGLADMHKNNIYHRDIKGANIMVDRKPGRRLSWVVKYIDFGFACQKLKAGGRNPCQSCDQCGTPAYYPPERYHKLLFRKDRRARTADSRAETNDIWALGVTLLEFMSGQVMYIEDEYKVRQGAPQWNDEHPARKYKVVDDSPKDQRKWDALFAIVEAMLCLDHKARLSAKEVLARVRRVR